MTLYTPILNKALHHESLNERQFHTYCLIMEKCWHPETGSFEWSEIYSMSSFARELGKPRMTVHDHIHYLAEVRLIEIHYFSDIAFALIPTATDGQPSEVTASRPITIKTDSLKREGILSDSKEKYDGQPSGDGQPSVPVEIAEILKNAGVGEPMRSKIANSGIATDDVKAWLNWMVAEGKPLSHAITGMRDGLPTPTCCAICNGWNGAHHYVIDEDNSFMECPAEGRPDLTQKDAFEMWGELSPVPH